ncbi:membrane protein [Modestobacter sp. DSM 44400]|uniref:hypothetical protein n=1 Tax=Modestobacter sp. DSM 44400 TaxID=1550230 RepID=UPI00089CAED6|nr:hypothetical protein [Modestobacter sp. DSM 44400]SDY44507.1 membrane protein [Modestobacter sp. DSM 44400]
MLLYPLLRTGRLLADLHARPGAGAALGGFAVGYYSVLFVLVVPLACGFGVVAAGRLRAAAVLTGAFLTAASLSGFLQGFVLFLALPLDLGAPFSGLDVVGGVAAVGFWLFLLHLGGAGRLAGHPGAGQLAAARPAAARPERPADADGPVSPAAAAHR